MPARVPWRPGWPRSGAVVIDADRLAREVVEPGTPGLAAVVEAFGDGVLTADGALDRAAMAGRIFGDDAARATLEGIVHPLVRARTAELIAAAPDGAVVVNDVPLIVEKRMSHLYETVVVVFASLPTRLDRLVRLRGMTPAGGAARIAAQATDEQRRAVADVVDRQRRLPGGPGRGRSRRPGRRSPAPPERAPQTRADEGALAAAGRA